MDFQYLIVNVLVPVVLSLLSGGIGVSVYNSRKDRHKQIAAQPIETKKLELDATDRVIENMLQIQESIVNENARLNTRITEMQTRFESAQTESDRKFKEIQALLDDAVKKIGAYRRYIQRVRTQLQAQNIQMPEPDPKDAELLEKE
jgi:chromosome segregation ATPase